MKKFSIQIEFKKNIKKNNITLALTPVIAYLEDEFEVTLEFMFGPLEIMINYYKK